MQETQVGPLTGKIPHAAEQLSPSLCSRTRDQVLKAMHLRASTPRQESRRGEKPEHCIETAPASNDKEKRKGKEAGFSNTKESFLTA